MPCQRDIALKGLSALNVLSDLRAVRLALSSTARLRMDTQTITKSRQVHMDVKYLKGKKHDHQSHGIEILRFDSC